MNMPHRSHKADQKCCPQFSPIKIHSNLKTLGPDAWNIFLKCFVTSIMTLQ